MNHAGSGQETGNQFGVAYTILDYIIINIATSYVAIYSYIASISSHIHLNIIEISVVIALYT